MKQWSCGRVDSSGKALTRQCEFLGPMGSQDLAENRKNRAEE
jgi:hypothetical protein